LLIAFHLRFVRIRLAGRIRLDLVIGEVAEVFEEVRERGGELAEVAAVEAFIGGVGIGPGVFDAEEGRSAAEEVGEGADEAGGAAASMATGLVP
jgi:hypothetical protein